MNTLLAPLWEISEFEEIQKQLDKENGCVALTGCIESQKLHMAYGLSEGRFRNRIFVTYSDQRIKELLEDERFYDREAVVYPSRDLIFYQADIHGNQLTKERIKTLRRILEVISDNFSMDRWLITSKLRMDSISSPHNSIR